MERMKRKRRGFDSKNRRSHGFSLIEIIIVVVVTGIIIMAINPLLKTNLLSYVTVKNGKNNLETARLGFNRMISELRRLQDPLNIRFNTSTGMEFDGMFYRDDVIATKTIVYTYDPSAGVVTRSEGYAGTSTLIDNVTSFQIEYLDKDGNAVATQADIWRLRVSLTMGSGSSSAEFVQEIHPKAFGARSN